MRIFLLSALVMSIGSCGVVESPPDGAGFRLTLADDRIEVPIQGSVDVAVTLERDPGFTAPVELSLEGAPAGVTATLASAPADGAVATLTVRVAAGPRPGEHAVMVTGGGGGKSAQAAATVVIEPMTVAGRLVEMSGAPLADHLVGVAGGSEARTGADGTFRIGGVVPPYDLYAFGTAFVTNNKTVVVYQGLTRPDPIVQHLAVYAPAGNMGTIAGRVTGGEAIDASHQTPVILDVPGKLSGQANPAADGSYSMTNPAWFGPSAVSGKVHALQWRTLSGGGISAFTGYTSAAVTMTQSSTATANLTLGTVATQTITGISNVPPGYTFGQAVSYAQLGSATLLLEADNTGPDFSFKVPAIPGVGFKLWTSVNASNTQSQVTRTGLAPGANVTITYPNAPTLLGPADGATGVGLGTAFSWQGLAADAVAVFSFQPAVFGTSGPHISVVTRASQLPRLPSFPGYELPANTGYTWTVQAIGPYASVDEAAADRPLRLPLGTLAADHDRHEATAPYRGATTP